MKKMTVATLALGLTVTATSAMAYPMTVVDNGDSETVIMQDTHIVLPGQESNVAQYDTSTSTYNGGDSLTNDSMSAGAGQNEQQLQQMNITYNKTTRKLEKVTVQVDNTSTFIGFDSLFINTGWDGKDVNDAGSGSNWQNWDYFVHTGTDTVSNWEYTWASNNMGGNVPGDGLYSVNSTGGDSQYTHTGKKKVWASGNKAGELVYQGRVNHANGIDADYLTKIDGSITREFEWWYEGTDPHTDYTLLTWDFSSADIILGKEFAIAYTTWCSNDVMLAAVPEPATMALFGIGVLGLAALRRRRDV